MTSAFGQRGVLYALLLIALIFSGFKAINGLTELRNTIDLSPDSITGYDGHRAEVEFTRFLDSLSSYSVGIESIDLDEVTTRFDILWARCQLFIKGRAFEAMREHAGIGNVASDLLKTLQEIEDDVFELERGDLQTLNRLRMRLVPFEAALTGMTTRVADLEVETRDYVNEAIQEGIGTLDGLALTFGLVVVVLLSLFGFEALHARKAERQLVAYQEHLEHLVDERTDELRHQAVRLEQALERERELTNMQRQFVSLVSHEFRTPLAIIDGQAQRLIKRGDMITPDQKTTALEKVRSAVRRLTDLMESVLSSASLEAGSIAFTPAPLNLKALVQQACEGQQEISKSHQINADIDALPETYIGDAKLLFQVVTNLLSNAVKYSPDANQVSVTGRSSDEGLEIAIRDFGVGIPEDELPKISQRFFRASTSSGIQGTGIGLNLVKSLVEMHSGVMEISSQKGEGSTFTVKLPHSTADDQTGAAAA